ncbi:hypothetical protein F5883DRAFT_617262, partial [Diaporthe sp. PMI_573]
MDLYATGNGCSSRNTPCDSPYSCFATDQDGCNGVSVLIIYKIPTLAYCSSSFLSLSITSGYGTTWKDGVKKSVYFNPDFDETEGYYEASDEWCRWVSSWESAWPQIADSVSSKPGDVSKDEKVPSSASGRDKGYMIGLSPLQYKNAVRNSSHSHVGCYYGLSKGGPQVEAQIIELCGLNGETVITVMGGMCVLIRLQIVR